MLGRFKIFQKSVLLIISIFLIIGLNFNLESCKGLNENTLYVGGDGSGNYSSIQDAINNSFEDDTILIYNGSYFESIVINKPINLVGLDKNTTFINGNDSLYTILIKSPYVNITRLSIINGKIGIYVLGKNYSHNNVSNNIIYENIEGIHLDNTSNNIIFNNLIHNNTNYGISAYESSNNFIHNNTIEKNAAGLYLGRWSDYNVLSNNTVIGSYYSINLDSSFNNKINDNFITENTIGIILSYSRHNNITNNNFSFNRDSAITLSKSDENTITLNTYFNNYQDVKKESTPPDIKAPGFELFFLICAIVIVVLSKRAYKTKN